MKPSDTRAGNTSNWATANLVECVVEPLRMAPKRIVLSFEGKEFPAEKILQRIAVCRNWVQGASVAKGDIVALYLENEPDWLAAFYALLSVGAVVIPINPALSAQEVARIFDIGRPKVVISRKTLLAVLADDSSRMDWQPRFLSLDDLPPNLESGIASEFQIGNVAADDPAVIFFTSGSSGEPKGVVCSHRHERWAIFSNIANWGIGPADTTLVSLPLAFVYGSIMTATTTLVAGGKISLLRRFHPEEAIKACRRDAVTVLPGVPTMFSMLAQVADEGLGGYDGLQWAFSGGDLLVDSVIEGFRKYFHVPIFDIFGITEARPIAGYTRNVDREPVIGTCGRVYPGVDIRLVDDEGRQVADGEPGELVIGGPAVASGYFRNEGATQESFRAGEFWSGDIACLSPDGFLRIVGRKKNIVKRGGMTIAPAEVEMCIAQHPSVRDVVVIPKPDPLFGHELVAVVVVSQQTDEASLRSFCEERLARYKVPRWILFRADLPKGPTGKIDRKLLAVELDRELMA